MPGNTIVLLPRKMYIDHPRNEWGD